MVRLRIQAAGRFTPPASQLTPRERMLVFRAVQSVIAADGFLAQPGADLLVSLRSELGLEGETELGADLSAEELREAPLSPAAADYLCYMAMLAGYADGQLTVRVLDQRRTFALAGAGPRTLAIVRVRGDVQP